MYEKMQKDNQGCIAPCSHCFNFRNRC